MLVALASVLVALVFNALQVRDTARQANESQRSVAFTTLMNMYDRIVSADHATTTAVSNAVTRVSKEMIVKADEGDPSAGKRLLKAQQELLDAIAALDGVVSALDNDVVPLAGARELWTNYLVCDYREVRREFERQGVSVRGLEGYFPHLASFNERHPGPRDCVLGTYE